MTTKRTRKLTDPDEIAASAAFAVAWKKSGLSQQYLAEMAGVSPGAVSQWATTRLAIPAERAKRVADLVGVEPETISPSWKAIKAQMGYSQPQRLDPLMMAESLVTVLKIQEGGKREFKPGLIARALCALYEVRQTLPARMSPEELKAFDVLVKSNVERIWNEEEAGTGAAGGVVKDRGGKYQGPASQERKRAKAG